MRYILVSVQKDQDSAMPYPGLSTRYCAALADAGLVPFLASCVPVEMQASACDALLLTGGGDMTPEYYAYHLSKDYLSFDQTERDWQEFSLLRAFLEAEKPVFGICRGMQLMNTALGGTLWEDLETECGTTIHTGGSMHEICLTKESVLRGILSDHLLVNSFHHQACRDPAPGFIVDAHSPDGMIEAFHHNTLPLYGVQWHPERMMGEGDHPMRRLFRFWRGIIENGTEREKKESKTE